ncbi:MMPL/RND family transporter [Mycolicibacterium lutetiense]|jgi:putative drug exporter of the RND superfamily|uniref:RND superfamily putative drug exporter n=1 Tax=Mycolicibacterium lutetiense TaxID=1641992 RepID=A0ABS4ZXP4_9MYCO|nr:MMPL family transporter [Mycolicibacterium lutetiense]MBP2454273.1 RND superfamily putative drug exporter [Mycolicibacterium lutetiense]
MSRHNADAPTGPITRTAPARYETAHFGKIARVLRKLSVPIILVWVGIAAFLNVAVPQLEDVGEMRSVSMSPQEAPAVIATQRIGQVFDEYTSNSSAMIVLEGQEKLGEDSRRYYSELIEKLRADTKHVEHVQDLWSDPLTASGVQSGDGKAVYVSANLAGDQGEALSLESVEAVKRIAESIPAPDGVEVFVTGSAAMTAEQTEAGHGSMRLVEALTFLVIIVMLLTIFRSIMTTVLIILMVAVSLLTVRGAVAFLGYYEIIGLSTFATSLLVTLAIAISVDYAIFFVGRYQEARHSGEDRESAYYTMFGGTAHVIVGSGLTIAGATYCLSFTRLPYFQTLGVPLAIGMLVLIATALTFGPAMVTVAGRFVDPKRAMRVRGWRKVGAAVVRWPGPILIATIAVSLIGLLALPGYKTSYNDRLYLPGDIASNQGYAAAERHFSPARLNPEMLMIESDRDLRNPADFLVIEKIAKAVFQVEGIGRVQTITRPDGTPIKNTTIPYMISQQSTLQRLNEKYNTDRTADMTNQVADMQNTIESMDKMTAITIEMADTTSQMVSSMDGMVANLETLRDNIANFDDFFRPIRNYLYWEPHCFNIPMCWSIRSVFDVIDGMDVMTSDMNEMMPQMRRLNTLMPQMIAIMPEMKQTMVNMREMMLTMQQTQQGMQEQQRIMAETSTEMGKAFTDSMNDDSFYLPAEAFENPDFAKGLEQFLSPDGHAVRFIINHEGDPMSAAGIERIDSIKNAAKKAIKGTPFEGSTIYLGGTAATFKDMADGTKFDLIIAGVAAVGLIFLIMLLLTRAIVAAVVIVGTVVLSLGASFGVSVLLWQYLLGIELHWMVLPMAVIILLAVGADYNLLVVSRLKEEIHAGLNTGMIRALGGSGSTVTAAGMVFAFTMMVMAVSDLTIMGQVGTTIGLGLLFDTLVIRAFMTPSIAALLGKWFWWPQRVRSRPIPQPWPPIQRQPQEALV